MASVDVEMSVHDHVSIEEALKHSYETMAFADIVIYCQDGDVPAHRSLLCLASDLCRSLLESNPDAVAIIIPDVSARIMKQVLAVIYTGQAYSPSKTDFTDVMSAFGLLGIDAKEEKHWEIKKISSLNGGSTDVESEPEIIEIRSPVKVRKPKKRRNSPPQRQTMKRKMVPDPQSQQHLFNNPNLVSMYPNHQPLYCQVTPSATANVIQAMIQSGQIQLTTSHTCPHNTLTATTNSPCWGMMTSPPAMAMNTQVMMPSPPAMAMNTQVMMPSPPMVAVHTQGIMSPTTVTMHTQIPKIQVEDDEQPFVKDLDPSVEVKTMYPEYFSVPPAVPTTASSSRALGPMNNLDDEYMMLDETEETEIDTSLVTSDISVRTWTDENQENHLVEVEVSEEDFMESARVSSQKDHAYAFFNARGSKLKCRLKAEAMDTKKRYDHTYCH